MRNSEGIRYYENGRYEDALESFQTASRLNPEDSEIYYNIASTYQKQAINENKPALYAEAEKYYRQCLDRNPSPETSTCCYRGLATILVQENKSNEAMTLLRSWEERNPSSVEPKLEIAYLLEAQGANRDSIAALEKIAEYAPNDYRAYYKLGLLHEKLGEEDAALQQLRRAAQLSPADATSGINERIAAINARSNGSNFNAQQDMTASNNPPLPEPKLGDTQASYPPSTDRQVATSSPQVSTTPPTANNPFNMVPSGTSAQFSQTQAAAGTSQAPPTDAPSYGAPATGAPAAAPIGTLPAADPFPADDPFAPTSQTNAPATLPLTPHGALPDGTGVNPFDLVTPQTAQVQPTTAPQPPMTASLPSTPSVMKVRVSDPVSGPPMTSVGAPF